MNAGIELSLRIGQRVRKQDYKGQRVTGVIIGLTVEGDGRELMVDLILDAPIVIPARGELPAIDIHRQHVPAHELLPFDERDELIDELLAALERTRSLLAIAEGQFPKEFNERVRVAVADARAAIAKATGGAA